MQMLGEATSFLHVERAPSGQQSHQHQHQRTRQEVGERLEALCSRLQTFEDQAAVDRTRNLQARTRWKESIIQIQIMLNGMQNIYLLAAVNAQPVSVTACKGCDN